MPARVLPFPAGRAGTPPRRRPRTTPAPALLDRGVRLSPFLLDGRRALVAVDSRGHRIADVALAADADAEAIGEMLYQLLDAVDPVASSPRLELVP